jgi:thioredoxin reductase
MAEEHFDLAIVGGGKAASAAGKTLSNPKASKAAKSAAGRPRA